MVRGGLCELLTTMIGFRLRVRRLEFRSDNSFLVLFVCSSFICCKTVSMGRIVAFDGEFDGCKNAILCPLGLLFMFTFGTDGLIVTTLLAGLFACCDCETAFGGDLFNKVEAFDAVEVEATDSFLVFCKSLRNELATDANESK